MFDTRSAWRGGVARRGRALRRCGVRSIVFASPVLIVFSCISPPVPPAARPSAASHGPGAELSDAPAARQFKAWLAALDTGSRTKLEEFLQTNFPARASAAVDQLRLRRQTGGFELRRAEQSTSTTWSAIVEERDSEQYARAEVEVEPVEPHRILRLAITRIPTPPEFMPPHMSESEAVAALSKRLETMTKADRFAGAVLVARNGTPIFARAYGLANRERRLPNELGTRFRIGSLNKMFTATAVLELVQAGKIDLEAPLARYLPDYPNQDLARKVSIRHLLTHTGGTGDIFGPEFVAHRLELRTLDDYIKLYGTRDLAFEPGTRWAYSNYGFILLGAVIEKASLQGYYEYVDQHVFEPAGMRSTGSQPEAEAAPDISVGYTEGDGIEGWRSNVDTLPVRGTSAGGGYSTVEDLLRFADALLRHKLLDTTQTERLMTGQGDMPDGSRYAYGLGETTIRGVRWIGHAGGAPGQSSQLLICPELGYVVVGLSNLDPPAAQRAVAFITVRLSGP